MREMFTGKGALRTKKIMNHAKRKTCTINGKCNDVYPKTVKRFYVTLGRYEDEVELCDKEKEWFQLFQNEVKL